MFQSHTRQFIVGDYERRGSAVLIPDNVDITLDRRTCEIFRCLQVQSPLKNWILIFTPQKSNFIYFYRASMQESYHLFPAAASVASAASTNFSNVSENGASGGGAVSGAVAASYLNANRNMLSQYSTTPQTAAAGVAASSPISTSSATPPPSTSATVSSASPQPAIGNQYFTKN